MRAHAVATDDTVTVPCDDLSRIQRATVAEHKFATAFARMELVTGQVMPGGMTGAQLAQQLRTQGAQLAVIFTSGYDPHGTLDESENTRFLPKPFEYRALLRMVRTSLDEL